MKEATQSYVDLLLDLISIQLPS